MPLLTSSYEAPVWLPGPHAQTIYPSMFRRVDFNYDQQAVLPLPDGDQTDCHFSEHPEPRKCLVLGHGFEGDVHRPYVLGMAKAAYQRGYSVFAWHLRGCGIPNQKPFYYHSGLDEDLETVYQWVTQRGYEKIYVLGFSLGGNLALKWAAQQGNGHPQLVGVAGISVPCDLKASSQRIQDWYNGLYQRRFLRSLKGKVLAKGEQHAHVKWSRPKTIRDFDHHYTAPWHGYASAEDYYAQNMALQFLPQIRKPTYLLNAQNDTFISPSSTPLALAQDHPYLHLEAPKQGGHCGFWPKAYHGELYSEQSTLAFFDSL